MFLVRLRELLREQSQLLSESTLALGQTLLGVEEAQVCFPHFIFALLNCLFLYKLDRVSSTQVPSGENKTVNNLIICKTCKH